MKTDNFIQSLTELVEEYIASEESYSDDVQLRINTVTKELAIADPEDDLPDCDYYPMMDLVRMSASDPGRWEPDTDAITDVAAEYVFTE